MPMLVLSLVIISTSSYALVPIPFMSLSVAFTKLRMAWEALVMVTSKFSNPHVVLEGDTLTITLLTFRCYKISSGCLLPSRASWFSTLFGKKIKLLTDLLDPVHLLTLAKTCTFFWIWHCSLLWMLKGGISSVPLNSFPLSQLSLYFHSFFASRFATCFSVVATYHKKKWQAILFPLYKFG